MSALHFTVPGNPVPKERARRGKGGRWYTPQRTRDYARRVASAAGHSVLLHFGGWSDDGRYRVEVTVVHPDRRARDVDNVAKAILDGINRVTTAPAVWRDDSQVAELVVRRAEPDKANPRVEVTITPLAKETTR